MFTVSGTLNVLSQEYNEDVAKRYLQQTEEVVAWLKVHPNLKK